MANLMLGSSTKKFPSLAQLKKSENSYGGRKVVPLEQMMRGT
jgi:hypothetical protein